VLHTTKRNIVIKRSVVNANPNPNPNLNLNQRDVKNQSIIEYKDVPKYVKVDQRDVHATSGLEKIDIKKIFQNGPKEQDYVYRYNKNWMYDTDIDSL